MKTVLIGAALLGVLHVTASPAGAVSRPPGARPAEVPAEAEDGAADRSTRLARPAASFLAAPELRQAPLLNVGEGGEGGRGRWWRRHGYVVVPGPPVVYAPPPPVVYAPPAVVMAPGCVHRWRRVWDPYHGWVSRPVTICG